MVARSVRSARQMKVLVRDVFIILPPEPSLITEIPRVRRSLVPQRVEQRPGRLSQSSPGAQSVKRIVKTDASEQDDTTVGLGSVQNTAYMYEMTTMTPVAE